jgi:hypothetical protein
VTDDARDRLTQTIARIERHLGGPARVLKDDYVSVDLANPGTVLSWTHRAELPGPGDRSSVEIALREVAAEFAAEGWEAVDRSIPDEPALQLSRDGYDIAVTASRDGGRVVVGGSAPPVAAADVQR